MKDLNSEGLRIRDGKVFVLDQQLLPDHELWLECNRPEEMIEAIRHLKVRGAPLIGVAAAVCLAKYAENKTSPEDFRAQAESVRAARPTAVNLMWAVDRMLAASRESEHDSKHLAKTAEAIFEEDAALCEAIGNAGAALVQDGENLLTHCNAGALATAGIGTAVGVIRRAFEQGKKIHVYVDETRPLLQGGRLTAWEMQKHGIPHTVICDNMAAVLMNKGKIQRIFVGADRIAINGDFANKIGTYSVAVNARHHGIPFHPAAPYSTIDFQCPSGEQIPIEERAQEEVRGFTGYFGGKHGKVRWSPKTSPTFNPSFDVTPVGLVESLVLDRGVFTRRELESGCLKNLREKR